MESRWESGRLAGLGVGLVGVGWGGCPSGDVGGLKIAQSCTDVH